MSLYQFFASEKEMPAFDNMHVSPMFTNGEISALHFASGTNEKTAMRIIVEDDFCYASQHTDKKYINFIEWHYNDMNAKAIVDYIKVLLMDRFTVSLFNTWINDKTPIKTTKININELTANDIKNIWGQDSFERNECLIVFKSY